MLDHLSLNIIAHPENYFYILHCQNSIALQFICFILYIVFLCTYIMIKLYVYIALNLAIWNEHQSKIDMVHKLLRSSQDKLEEQIKMRNEQVSVASYFLYCFSKSNIFIKKIYIDIYFSQNKQLLSADMIVKELFIENARLMSMIHNLQTQIDHSSNYNSM